MSRTITAWAVVDEAGVDVRVFATEHEASYYIERYPLSAGSSTVVELTGELPPREWKVGDWYVIEDFPGVYQIAAPAAGNTFYVLHHLDPRKHVRLLEYVSMSAKPANAIPCDPPAWFTEGGAS
jgi:hypothetical protein